MALGDRHGTRWNGNSRGFMLAAVQTLATVISLLALIPYFWWGIYTLRRRFRFHDELHPTVEIITLSLLAVFYAFEWFLLEAWLIRFPVYLTFAALGLLVSGMALYGPMLISLLSRVLVDLIMPTQQAGPPQPQYGPAEALERQGDYEGANQEYYVILRIFPKDPTAAIRIGDNFMKLARVEEAVPWFERGLKYLASPQKSLPITNRLAEIYLKHLDRRQDAKRTLEEYLERFPASDYADSVRDRIRRLSEQQAAV